MRALVRPSTIVVGAMWIVAGSAPVGAAVTTSTPPELRAQAAPASSTWFEPNRGQTDARVDFVARCRGYVAFVTRGGGATFKTSVGAFRMAFVGADESVRASAVASAPGRSDYF